MSLPIASTKTERPTTPNPWVLSDRALTVFYGCPEMPRLSHYFLPRLLFAKKQILYLDGANQISPLLLARFARERGVHSSTVNSLIRVARAFTCFQLTELVRRVPKTLEKFSADVLIITALPDLYFDEDVRDREARASFEHALEGLANLAPLSLSIALFSDATSSYPSLSTMSATTSSNDSVSESRRTSSRLKYRSGSNPLTKSAGLPGRRLQSCGASCTASTRSASCTNTSRRILCCTSRRVPSPPTGQSSSPRPRPWRF